MHPSHLVSLTWNHPLPTAVVALALRPELLTVVSPASGEPSAKRLQALLLDRGLSVRLTIADDATNLDASAGRRPSMRDEIGRELKSGAWLDYTGGSKPMAVWARLCLGRDAAASARAVYLDVSTGLLRSDDGRAELPNVTLSAAELGRLHGTKVTHAGHLSDRPDLVAEAGGPTRALIAWLSSGPSRRLVSWRNIVENVDSARGYSAYGSGGAVGPQTRKVAADRLRRLVDDVARDRARMVPLWCEKEGDWLELFVADRVESVARTAGADLDVSLNVEARRQQATSMAFDLTRAHPSVRELVAELAGARRGRDRPAELVRALDDALRRSGEYEADHSQDTDLEVDVLAVRGHRVYAISCYAGSRPDSLDWKAHEIARRAVQVGGDYARAAFVCLAGPQACDELQQRLTRTHLAGSTVAVFGLADLQSWASEDSPPGLLSFLGLEPPTASNAPQDQRSVDHDLLATVGGSPIPVLQAVLAHGAQEPLLVHGSDSARTADLLRAVLHDKGISASLYNLGSAFEARTVEEALERCPPSVAVDFTGGTKVMATQAVLHHAGSGAVGDATYVDGKSGLLRYLEPRAPQNLPEVSLGDLLRLHDRQVVRAAAPGAAAYPDWPRPGETGDRAVRTSAARAIGAGLASVLSPTSEVLADATVRRADEREDHVDVLIRDGTRIAAMVVAWVDDNRMAARAAWPSLVVAEDLAGAYVRIALVAPVDAWARTHLERTLQGRSAGAPRIRVFGRRDLTNWQRGDYSQALAWLE